MAEEPHTVSNATLYSLLQTVDEKLETIHANQTKTIIPDLATIGVQIMAFAEDVAALTAAVTTLQGTVTTVASEMDKLLADLTIALSNSHAASDPAVQAAVANLETLNSTLQAAVTRDMPPASP